MKTSFDLFLENNGYTPKYKDQYIFACIKEESYGKFRQLTKFHKRGLRYTDEMENFLLEYQVEPIEYEDKYSYVFFKTHKGKEDETIQKLSKSKYIEFVEKVDNRKNESDKLIELSEEIQEFAEEYIEFSDNQIKEKIDHFIDSLTKIRSQL